MTSPNTPRVKDLFTLPDTIHRIEFVEQLGRAVERPKTTADTYVVTPALLGAFDRSLGLVASALRDGRSRAAFLHGSFGSGKSHFMALVSLLLDGNEEAWRVPELHALREKHGFVGSRKLLQLRFHMVGNSGNLEHAVFGRYLDAVRARHPGADLPGVFADEKLFADARRMLDELGDDAFFAPMNEGAKKADEWGSFGAGETWDRAAFDAASSSTDAEERARLFNALARTRFRAYAEESRQFIDLDAGLAVIGRHVKGLGYDGVVLFLDELILWLASRASDVAWFHNEVQKLVKLVESQDSRRDVPFVSFIARQRDLADMVGRDYAGLENALVRDSLKWSEGRYETITLEDRNLPAIAEKRVLRARDDSARKTLDDAFRAMRAKLGDAAWTVLLGELDEKEFRRLYPFSPALVDALVALSNALQRERTAIRLLTELLVEHTEDLSVGDVVGVGDLFDVIAGGDDTTDGVMRTRFESAKQLYAYHFLPVIQATHKTNTPEACQRLRPEHPARLGCSNCPQRACRTDNRLIKTLLIAALVPERSIFKDLTASRLVQLNHGSLRAPIPGTEVNIAATKLRTWASAIAQLHVGTQPDPTISLAINTFDPGPILEQARHIDSPGARQRVLRDLLFNAMGLEKVADWEIDHVEEWRGTRRLGHLVFGNVRRMGPEQLRCGEGHDWRLIVDYPFDDEEYGPRDDETVLSNFVDAHADGTWTLVWLPSFFSKEIKKMLGDIVVLEHILADAATTRQYVSHLSTELRESAQIDLRNLLTQKQSRMRQVIDQAYGLARVKDGDIDTSRTVEKHLRVLKPGAEVRVNLAATLADAIPHYVEALLDERYPRHPRFPANKRLTSNRVEELVSLFGDLVDAEDHKLAADRDRQEVMRGFLGELGLVRTTEGTVHLREDATLQDLEKKRQQKAADRPQVDEVRRWIDESGKMGLQIDAVDLVVRCYARWSARTLVSGDQPFEPRPGRELPGHVVLERPDLPSPASWTAALQAAGHLFGIALAGKALHGDNLKRLEGELRKKLETVSNAATRLPDVLSRRMGALGVPEDVDRMRTAASGEALMAALQGKKGKHAVEALATFSPATSARALGASIHSAADNARLLEDDLVFGPFTQLATRQNEIAGGPELLERVAQALRQDEINVPLAPRVRELAREALRLVNPPIVHEVIVRQPLQARGAQDIRDALRAAVEALEKALDGASDDVEISGTITLQKKK